MWPAPHAAVRRRGLAGASGSGSTPTSRSTPFGDCTGGRGAAHRGRLRDALPRDPEEDAIPGESEKIRAGDPDDQTLGNEYVGEETPGGSTPTPDQGNVDDIGRAYGVQEEDSGELRTSSEILEGRDHRRRGVGVRRRRS